MNPSVTLDGEPAPRDIERIALGLAGARLSERGWGKLAEAQHTLERLQEQLQQQWRPIYGLNTGFGPLVDESAHQTDQLQPGLIDHLCSGTGPALSRAQVRAVIAVRVATLARGHSGIRPEIVTRMLDWLELDVVPEVPRAGTVGASGDLTPLAHIARALTGGGRVSVAGGPWEPTEPALKRTGLAPVGLSGRDALALVNGTAAMTGLAGLNAARARRAASLAALLGLAFNEVLGGARQAHDPRLGELRPHPGQQQMHAWLTRWAADSRRLREPDQAPPQDPYTLRCQPQALGAVLDGVAFHQQILERELVSVTDNPVLFADPDEAVHGGNFYGQHVAMASDTLQTVVIKMAVIAERQIARINDTARNGELPPFLRGSDQGYQSGFMGAQVTASSLLAELRSQAVPASIQAVPTNADNQDINTMGTLAARKVDEALDRLFEILAIEAMSVAQGMQLCGVESFSVATRHLHDRVRRLSPALDRDRPLSEEIAILAADLADPACEQELFGENPEGHPAGQQS